MSRAFALSFRLHKELADEHGGKDRWGYRPVGVGAIELEGRKVPKDSIRAAADGKGSGAPVGTTHQDDTGKDGALPVGDADVSLEKEAGFDRSHLTKKGLPAARATIASPSSPTERSRPSRLATRADDSESLSGASAIVCAP